MAVVGMDRGGFSRKTGTVVAGFGSVPAVIALIFLTHDAILPHLPGHADTWNVQYFLHFAVAVAAGAFVWTQREVIGRSWSLVLILWNISFAAFALYAVFSLWGEKY